MDYPAVADEAEVVKMIYGLFSKACLMKLENEYKGAGKKSWDEVLLEASWDGKQHAVVLRGFVSRFSIDLMSVIQGTLKGQKETPTFAYDTQADDEEK